MPTRVNCGGSAEDLAELPVPADQVQVLVEHRDALAHVVERGLQDFAVVVDRRIGVVEELQRRLGRHRALAQQERQHEPRRRRPDRRGEQVLGVAQELEVGLAFGSRLDARASRHSCRTRCACAPRRDSARPSSSVPRPSPRTATAGSSARSARVREGTNRSACSRSIDAGARVKRERRRRRGY